MTIPEIFDHAYQRMAYADRQLLQKIHLKRGHTRWPAKHCIRCRQTLREQGINIPYYCKGIWTNSNEHHTPKPKKISNPSLMDRLASALLGKGLKGKK